MQSEGLISFLKTDLPGDKLRAALEVIDAFKSCESQEEWLMVPFDHWTRLEQLEGYLRLLTDVGADEVTDNAAREYLGKLRS